MDFIYLLRHETKGKDASRGSLIRLSIQLHKSKRNAGGANSPSRSFKKVTLVEVSGAPLLASADLTQDLRNFVAGYVSTVFTTAWAEAQVIGTMIKVTDYSVIHFEEEYRDERGARKNRRIILIYALGEDGIVYEMSGGKWLALPIAPELMRQISQAESN